MKIQQHDDVVADAAEFRQASPSNYRRRRCSKGRGRRQNFRCGCPPSPLLYIGPQGGAGPGDGNLPRGRRPGGWSAPQGKWCAPT